jgi:adenylate cyclase
MIQAPGGASGHDRPAMSASRPRRAAGPPPRVDLTTAQRLGLGAGVGLAVALLLLLARPLAVVERIELPLVDVRTRAFAGSRGPDPRIVLSEVLDADVAAVKRDLATAWPWPLDLNAEIFAFMARAGVRSVVVDVLHLDRGAGPDDVPGQRALTPEQEAEQLGEMGGAEAYAAAMKAIGDVTLAFELVDEPQYDAPARFEAAKGRRHVLTRGPAEPRSRRGADLPVRRVLEGARRLGFVNVPKDADGVHRRAYLAGRWGDVVVGSLAYAAAGGGELERGRAKVGGAARPVMEDGTILLDFRGAAHRTYPRVAPSKILEWARAAPGDVPVPPEARAALEGKIVVWGKNLAGEDDRLPTPMHEAHHGPEFQATAIDDLLHGDGRVRAPFATNAAILLVLCAAVGAVGVASKRSWVPHVAAVLALALVAAVAVGGFAAGTSVDVFTPGLGVLLAWGGALAAHRLTEGRYNRWLEGTFARYLAPEVIESLKTDPSLLKLGGARRNITVLFSDVAGFTKLSEALPGEATVSLLNEYLTMHCDAVLAQAGVIDKFLGDGVMAFFGDPVPSTDHAVRACRAALAVQERLPMLRPAWESRGLEDFPVRVGLNSGEALVGNMGSRQRFDYTCMGDAVNLASRLEGANKAFGTRILLGPETYASAREEVLAKPLADVVVVGREEPVAVYELVGLRSGAPPDLAAHVEAFARAHAAARRGDLDGAERALDEAERAKPGDGPVSWFRGVLERLRSGEEPSPWSGRYVLSSK